jgi:hypothetical protein
MLKKELTDKQAITLLLTAATLMGGARIDLEVIVECAAKRADQILNLEKQP